ncbi:hypothetical protein LEP1GSC074_3620 [Leptospira noguchii str. Hook]|nr:hypothetical protein LEP1GSC074_3620 [Leptospira noguchii str. Hook]
MLSLNAIHRERCVEFQTRPLGKRFAEFDFDSKILFNLWGWLWL